MTMNYNELWSINYDLQNINQSGLIKSQNILKEIKEISIINFDHQDVMRHPLVTKIVEAYQKNTNDKV